MKQKNRKNEGMNYHPAHLLIQKQPKNCFTCLYWEWDSVNGAYWGTCSLALTDSEEPEMNGRGKARAHVILPDTLEQCRAVLYADWDYGCVQHLFHQPYVEWVIQHEI